MVHSDEEQADFVSNLFAPDGAGYSRVWSPEVDSRLGLQLTASLIHQLTGTCSSSPSSVMTTTSVEGANLRYDIPSDLSVRAGRMEQSLLMVSDYRKVGYAIP